MKSPFLRKEDFEFCIEMLERYALDFEVVLKFF